MKLWRGLAILAVLTAPAYYARVQAQEMPHVNLVPEIEHKSAEEKEQDAIKDKAYRESLRKIPDAKTSADPWGGVRSSDAPAAPKQKAARTATAKTTTAATAKPKARAGDAAN